MDLFQHPAFDIADAKLRFYWKHDPRCLDLDSGLDRHREPIWRDVRRRDRAVGPDRPSQPLDRIDDVQAMVDPEGLRDERPGRMGVSHGW
ncbi:hypothetical protein L593_08895 [Salinarchaeum sp. Harcht-Bsk1]|nr:hypothetical protein L593_08895 [Salinarchaeum sp. Harcht-Bsk1]